MTDVGGPVSAPAPRGSTLGLRLALAFLSVALAAVALLAGLTAALAAADVSALTNQQRADLTGAIAVARLASPAGGEVQHRGQIGRRPAVVLVPRRPGCHRDRAGQVGTLL